MISHKKLVPIIYFLWEFITLIVIITMQPCLEHLKTENNLKMNFKTVNLESITPTGRVTTVGSNKYIHHRILRWETDFLLYLINYIS